jgi:putative membrane protein
MTDPSQTKQRTLKDCAGIAGAGVVMGAADVVPGVSGGTMAFILGIYEELLATIKSFNLVLIRRVFSLDIRGALEHINWKFLVSLGAGLAISILSLARLVTWLYDHQQINLFAFFFGLILASIIVIAGHVRWNAKTVVSLVAGTVIAYQIVRLVPVNMPNDPLTLLWCGAVAITAMILPGISGSFILLILGQYQHVMSAVKSLDIAGLLPFAIGAAGGLLIFARVLSWLLARFHQVMISFLTGFMIGSLWKIWPFREVLQYMDKPSGERVPVSEALLWPGTEVSAWGLPLLLCVIGFIAVVALNRLQKKHAPDHQLGG